MENTVPTTQPTEPTQEVKTTHPFWQHISKRTLALIIVLLLITGGLLYLALREQQPTPTVSMVPTPTPSPAHATLALVPETSTSSAFQTVDVVVQSNQNELSGAQLNIAYNPKVLTNVTIKPGSYFSNPAILFHTVDVVNGEISYVLGIGINSQQVSGKGILATISYTIQPTAATTTQLTFLPKTALTQQGVLESVLKNSTNLSIAIPTSLQLTPTASPAAQ